MRHICHISTTFNMRSANAQRTIDILKACVDHGYKTTLITGRDHDVKEDDIPGVNIIVIPELVKYVDLKSDIFAFFRLIKILREIKPDIVHTYLAKAGISGRLAASFCKVPFVMHTVHGPTFAPAIHILKRSFYWALEKICGSFTDLFIFVGEELRQTFIEATVCSERNSVVIHTGRTDAELAGITLMDEEKRKLRSALCDKHEAGFVMMIVGRVVPSKRHEHAITLLGGLRKKNIDAHLVIVGECLLEEERIYEQKLKAIITRQGLDPYISFSGYRSDILNVMSAADVIVMTSKYEGLPNVAVEAAIAGTPMVTYSVSGVAEVIDSGKTGYIVPEGDPAGMEEALLNVCSDKDLLSRFRENALVKIRGKFRRNIMIEQKLEIYRRYSESTMMDRQRQPATS